MKYISIIIFLISFIYNEKLYGTDYTISGYVTDTKSSQYLIGANIFIEGTSIGSATNEKGFYKITNIKEGTYTIKVSYIGYKTLSDTITIDSMSDMLDGNVYTKDFKLNYTTIEGNEVTVTAQAKGQMAAINKQLNAKSLVNIISSDRIRELPDANAAETVARVPGVSIQREGGEGNKVVVRGLSPKYNSITVNGVKLASTDNEDRSTDLSMISQYMLDGIEVTKAGTPDLDSDVLGGTVNFLLKKAQPGFHFNVITQGMHNGLKSAKTSSDQSSRSFFNNVLDRAREESLDPSPRDTDENGSKAINDSKLIFEVSNRFWNDRIGLLAQIDLENRNRSSNELGTSYNLMGEQLDSVNTLSLESLNLNDIIRINDRDNRLFVFDIKIPNGNISYSNLNSKIDKDITNYAMSYALSSNYRYMSSATNDNSINVLTESWAYNQTFFSKLHIDAFNSFSKSINNKEDYIFSFDEPFAYDTSTYNQNLDVVQKIAKNDTANMAITRYDFWKYNSKESEKTFGINVKYDFRLTNYISGNLKIGNKFRTKKRSYDRHHEFGTVSSFGAYNIGRVALIDEFDIGHFITVERGLPLLAFIDNDYSDENFFDGRYSFGAVADLDYMMTVYDFFSKNFNKITTNSSIDEYVMHHIHQTDSQIYDYVGEEKYDASYIMTDIDLGPKLNIVYGMRRETNETLYYSNESNDHALPHWVYIGESVFHKRKNSFNLPALFLKYKPLTWLDIRYANTTTLTRPNYTSLIPLIRSNGRSPATLQWRNKNLKPGISKNNDLSISIHQDKIGLITVGYFDKTISNLIYSSGSRILFDDDTTNFDLSGNYVGYKILNYELNNPNDILLKGWEFDFQTRLLWMPGLLKGLVFNANYTISDSEVKYPLTVIESEFDWGPPLVTIQTNVDTIYIDRLLDQPDKIINLSIGYDYKGFSGRLSMLNKDNVFMSTNFWPELRQTTDPYTRWDLSIKQDLPVNGLELFLNVSNITESIDVNRYRGFNSYGNNLKSEQHYGRTVDLGFRYSF